VGHAPWVYMYGSSAPPKGNYTVLFNET
jgi:hypothetical protein